MKGISNNKDNLGIHKAEDERVKGRERVKVEIRPGAPLDSDKLMSVREISPFYYFASFSSLFFL